MGNDGTVLLLANGVQCKLVWAPVSGGYSGLQEAHPDHLAAAGFVPKAELEHAKKCRQEEYESRCRACLRAEALERQVEQLRATLADMLDAAHPILVHPLGAVRLQQLDAFRAACDKAESAGKPTPEPGEPVGGKAICRACGQYTQPVPRPTVGVDVNGEAIAPPVPAEPAGESELLDLLRKRTIDITGCVPEDALEKTPAELLDMLDLEVTCEYDRAEQFQSALTRAEGRVRETEALLELERVVRAYPLTKNLMGVPDALAALDALRAQPPLASSVVADEATTGEGGCTCGYVSSGITPAGHVPGCPVTSKQAEPSPLTGEEGKAERVDYLEDAKQQWLNQDNSSAIWSVICHLESRAAKEGSDGR